MRLCKEIDTPISKALIVLSGIKRSLYDKRDLAIILAWPSMISP